MSRKRAPREHTSMVEHASLRPKTIVPSKRSLPRRTADQGTPGDRPPLTRYRPDIVEALVRAQAPSYRYDQVFEHLLRRPSATLADATTLPNELRRSLDALGLSTLAPSGVRTASDDTTKLLLAARDGALVETVVIPQGQPHGRRATVCISSQSGCPVGCRFCATGAMGFRRNLSAAEIVDQVRAAAVTLTAAQNGSRISNLVFMGMGEPLLNLQAVLDSIRILTDPHGMDLAHRAISVSTVGIPAGIRRLARSEPQVNLALSLHAADDQTRAALIPKTFRHPLEEILEAAWEHFAITHRKLMVEYVLLGGINDSTDDARRLAALLRGHVVTVNLLRWNTAGERPAGRRATLAGGRSGPVPAQDFHPSAPASVAAFREALLSARVETVIRRSRGADIQAACGQLAGRVQAAR